MSKHPDHSAELKRINRMIGQLQGVKKMIEDGVYCPEILIQTKAVGSALKSLEVELLRAHVGHCVKNARSNESAMNDKLSELVDIFKTRIK